jgi:Uma2 family endonuclease
MTTTITRTHPHWNNDDDDDDEILVAESLTDYERERGKPMPSFNHAFLQKRLIAALLRYEPQYLVLPEIALELGDERYTPDIAIVPHRTVRWHHDIIRYTEPPLLTIEILSPRQALADLFVKADAYLRAGVYEAWVLIPELHSITVCSPACKQQTYLTGEVRHVQTGITLNIEELFALS